MVYSVENRGKVIMKVLPSFRMMVNAFHPFLTHWLVQKIKSRASFSKISNANTKIGRDNTYTIPVTFSLSFFPPLSHTLVLYLNNSIPFSTYAFANIISFQKPSHACNVVTQWCADSKKVFEFELNRIFLKRRVHLKYCDLHWILNSKTDSRIWENNLATKFYKW